MEGHNPMPASSPRPSAPHTPRRRGRDYPRCRATGGKRIFATSAAAEAELAAVQRRRADGLIRHRPGKGGRVEQRTYPCLQCGRHHLTAEDEPAPEFVLKPRNRGRGRR